MSAPGSEVGVYAVAGASGAASREPLLVVDSAAKSFGPTRALVHCDLSLYPGEIHALVGENGSGKSTLIKLLSGVLRPDSGTTSWEGKRISFRRPLDARQLGISTVFQEVLVGEESSLRDNIFSGVDGLFRRAHDRGAEEEIAGEVLEQLGMGRIDLDMPVWRLSLGQKQLLTVTRAVVRPCRLLILDEPTSALDVDDRERLFAFVQNLISTRDVSVLFVSHRMDEIQRLAARVTVLRTGRSVAAIEGSGTPEHLAELMSGRREQGDDLVPTGSSAVRAPARERVAGELRLVATDVVLRPGRAGFSLGVREGEILGVAGLEGHGQSAFLEAVAGLRKLAGGTIAVGREDGGLGPVRNFSDAFRKGVAYVPRDRKSEGIFSPLSILDNVSLPSLTRYSRFGILNRSKLQREMYDLLQEVRLQSRSIKAPISSLSGGNQQKVLLARWLAVSPKILLLNDPMRGVDLGVKTEFYRILERLAGEGMTILFLSTEVEELCRACDRIAVFHEQRCENILAGDVTASRVVRAMFGEGQE